MGRTLANSCSVSLIFWFWLIKKRQNCVNSSNQSINQLCQPIDGQLITFLCKKKNHSKPKYLYYWGKPRNLNLTFNSAHEIRLVFFFKQNYRHANETVKQVEIRCPVKNVEEQVNKTSLELKLKYVRWFGQEIDAEIFRSNDEI